MEEGNKLTKEELRAAWDEASQEEDIVEVEKPNKVSKISIGFSVASLIAFALPLGFVAFILALIAIGKGEKNGTLAIILSFVVPISSFMISLMLMGLI